MSFRTKMNAIMLGLAAPLFLSLPVEAAPIQNMTTHRYSRLFFLPLDRNSPNLPRCLFLLWL